MIKKTAPGCAGNIGAGRNVWQVTDGFDVKVSRPKLLLHSCCGPCSTAVIERLIEDYQITVFFYNPNITDPAEYEKRLDAQKKVIDYFNSGNAVILDRIELLEGKYSPDDFFKAATGLEEEPEGGRRCARCFELRLNETAKEAKLKGFDCFGTTLTVSPHKDYSLISKTGRAIGSMQRIEFLDLDFKKQNGFLRSVELSREIGIYRQNYCGCEFSKWFEKDK